MGKAPSIPAVPFSPVIEQISQPFSETAPALPSMAATTSSNLVPAVLFAVWLCGFAFSAFVWFRLWRRFRAALRSATLLRLDLPIPVMNSPTRHEPGVFGIRKPILLLPEGIANRLTPAQLQSILAHELCHVRRRDNLAAAIHMVVESIFWFHPLVWWIGTRLVEERERACDEEVVRLGNEPHVYAEGILNVCKFYLQSPLACASGVTGSDLKKRIEAIVNQRISHRMTLARKLLLAAAGIVAVAGPVVTGLVNAPRSRAQSAASAFEVASIKLSNPEERGIGMFTYPGGRIVITKFTLKMLIQEAYGVHAHQVSGGPKWADDREVRYSIVAKPPASSKSASITPKNPKLRPPEEEILMLRTLLADRFQLKLREETMESNGYALVVDSRGPKLSEPKDKEEYSVVTFGITGKPDRPNFMRGHNATTARFTERLSQHLKCPVVDRTGLTGSYDFVFEYTQHPTENVEGPTIFSAIQKLGLKLVAAKAPEVRLVIDHAEKPSAN